MGDRTDLDWHLSVADRHGDRSFADMIADLRWELVQAARHADWQTYNVVRAKLNEHGALIPAVPIPKSQENIQMGMFDKPLYLTGDEGYVTPGDVFWLHNAKIDGTVTINGREREQAKLLVSRERDGATEIVLSSGAGIVNQVKRMDASDRAAMPVEVRLDQVPSDKGNPTNVLTPASEDAPTGAASTEPAF